MATSDKAEMDSNETAVTTLETKLIQLGRARDKADAVLRAGKERAIRRHIESLKDALREVSKWQGEVEAGKILRNEDAGEIEKWSDDVENKMEEADQKISILEEWLSHVQTKREDQERKERMNFEIRLQEEKLNVQAALSTQRVAIHCWLDSTVALYWINDQGEYRQFVANRVHKIRQHDEITWHHVPTVDNPADLGSRGGKIANNRLWREGLTWLRNPSEWPPDRTSEPTADTRSEAKMTREILKTAQAKQDVFDQLLDKHPLAKVLRIGAWTCRFVYNCKNQSRDREVGHIRTWEIKQQQLWWIRRAQETAIGDSHFQADHLRLNLQPNAEQVLECKGRIIGEYPIYLPDAHPFTAQVVRQAHISTLQGGIPITMAKVRERYWVPRLTRLVKKMRKSCHGCKRFQSKAYQTPTPGNLPTTRTQGSTPFQVLGVDFAGPIKYALKSKWEAKAYLVL